MENRKLLFDKVILDSFIFIWIHFLILILEIMFFILFDFSLFLWIRIYLW